MYCVRFVSRAMFWIGALVALAAPASAAIVSTVVDNGDGTFTYSFEVDNTSGGFDISAWSLEFDFDSPDWDQLDVFSGGSVAVPDPNWIAGSGIPVSGLSTQDFISLSPDTDVLVGSVLGGFSFTSAYAPGVVTFVEFSALGDSASGTVVGPGAAPIPEPRTVWTFLLGGALVAFAIGRRAQLERV